MSEWYYRTEMVHRNDKGENMATKLDPTVIDQLRADLSLTSFEQVGQKLGRTAFTIRNWYHGRSVPSVPDLVKLQFLTGRPYGTMLIIADSESKAA